MRRVELAGDREQPLHHVQVRRRRVRAGNEATALARVHPEVGHAAEPVEHEHLRQEQTVAAHEDVRGDVLLVEQRAVESLRLVPQRLAAVQHDSRHDDEPAVEHHDRVGTGRHVALLGERTRHADDVRRIALEQREAAQHDADPRMARDRVGRDRERAGREQVVVPHDEAVRASCVPQQRAQVRVVPEVLGVLHVAHARRAVRRRVPVHHVADLRPLRRAVLGDDDLVVVEVLRENRVEQRREKLRAVVRRDADREQGGRRVVRRGGHRHGRGGAAGARRARRGATSRASRRLCTSTVRTPPTLAEPFWNR